MIEDLRGFVELSEPALKRWVYPGGEVGVRVPNECPKSVLWRMQSSDDVMAFLMAASAAMTRRREAVVEIESVFIPYMPYARQDRVAVPGDPVAIDVFAWQIYTTGVRRVVTLDAHSDATRRAFEKSGVEFINIDPLPYMRQFAEHLGKPGMKLCLVSPDEGAKAKTTRYAEGIKHDAIIYCDKERNPVTGDIKGFNIVKTMGQPNNEYVFLILDDICDGGRTFYGVKDALCRQYPAASVCLWTSHGIYSKGLSRLTYEFKFVGSTDSFKHGLTHPALVTIPLL